MYILDKNHDFYDHFSKIYGEDKSITFDRRGSHILSDDEIIVLSHQYDLPRSIDKEFVVLEIGNKQHLIQLTNFKFRERYCLPDEIISCDMSIVRTFDDHKHYYDSPMSIRGCHINYRWRWKHFKGSTIDYVFNESYSEVIRRVYNNAINLPILAETRLTSIINAHDVWVELQTYFSSLGNDKDISIPMTDIAKAEIHGFDKKTSFRNPIKIR